MKLTCRTLALATALGSLPFAAAAQDFNVPSGDLKAALDSYKSQSGISLFVPRDAMRGVQTHGVKGDLSPDEALTRILRGTGFTARHDSSGMIAIIHDQQSTETEIVVTPNITLAQATAPQRAAVETVTVTSSKLGGADVQSIPIAITALSQEQLTATQTAGGPDLVKQVPNLTFTKTNFSGYSIQIRGIGTQAISVTTDPAVAVALDDIPFIRNHFFEQEFFDLSQAEVLRGPQGTLYGRNATAGVVNLITAKPTDQFEAMASADIGNYKNRRFEGMINLPILDDRFDLRIAGEWTKRDGYTINENTGDPVDGRDLWSTRATLGWKPSSNSQIYLVWEHFSEDDDRMRTQKQLCKTDNPTNHPGLLNVNGVPVPIPGVSTGGPIHTAFSITTGYLSQGCLPASLYSKDSFEVPYGFALPYVVAGWISDGLNVSDPYASTTQSTNLRVIETQIDPKYRAKNDTVEFNADYNITPSLTFTSQTGYNNDFLYSTEDYNRFNTTPGIFKPASDLVIRGGTLISPYSDCSSAPYGTAPPDGTYYFGDPQLGCSNRIVAQDVSQERAWQFAQEFRLASNFKGAFNFSVGGNYMHYETVEDYFVFANVLTMFAATSGDSGDGPWVPGVTDNLAPGDCLSASYTGTVVPSGGVGHQYNNPTTGAGQPTSTCYYIDPNPLGSVNSEGHNYFLSQNPYVLNSYAGFGEFYYNVLSDLKLTGGIRWTDDQKHFVDIPSELLSNGYGYMPVAVVNQQWNQFTGRLAANWTPKLDFTDQTLIYGSWAHGYKAGGANPPGATLYSYAQFTQSGIPVHPLTFKPEFVDAYELGSKNTLLDGGLTLNGDVFFYNYSGYQISEIVDRTSINLNFNATVKGAELEAMYEPFPGLKFNFAGGYEDTRIDNGQSSVDLMDRTAGHPGWILFKPFVTLPSNCILPDYVVAALIKYGPQGSEGNQAVSACGFAYTNGEDPVVGTLGGKPAGYPGFDPVSPTATNTYNGVDYGPAPNDGAGFSKDLGGNELPNAPHFTLSASADYTIPLSAEWAGTAHLDYYWQDYSWARVFNDNPYDRLRGYTNVNLALILTSQNGWQVMGYLKNVFDTTAITGTFLNSDDSGLTTNVFLTDPRLFGVRVTKNW